MRLHVLGAPYPNMDSAYRGVDRDIPLYREDLAETHPANEAMLAAIAMSEGGAPIRNLALAHRLCVEYNALAGTDVFEVVELVAEGALLQTGSHRYGIDLVLEGGVYSLLDAALVLAPEGDAPSDETARGRDVAAFRIRSRSLLNRVQLLETWEDARSVLDEASELERRYGPIWEGEGFHWEPFEVWLVGAAGGLLELERMRPAAGVRPPSEVISDGRAD